ncbi:MAG: LacI family DNA-binding transcriptional regulator [Nakamurella sp.]
MKARNGRTPVTMQDVAQLAGVSVKTVSNVLSDYPHVSATTRERVTIAVAELGYTLNVSARNLRIGRTRVLGLAIPELSQAYFAELADAIIRRAGARGYTVLIEQTLSPATDEIDTVEIMRRHSIDGLIYSPLSMTASDVRRLDAEFPMVVLGDRVRGSRADHVTMANAAAIRAATEHLLGIGRRRIAVIGARPEGPVGAGASRLQGYTGALETAGIDIDTALIRSAALWHRADGVRATEELIADGTDFDGLVCFNDALALGAMHALQRHGRTIPDDVAVVGFDDIEDGAFATPSLTTVSPRRDEVAETAVGLLVDRLAEGSDRTAPRHVEIGYTMVLRDSTATGTAPGSE